MAYLPPHGVHGHAAPHYGTVASHHSYHGDSHHGDYVMPPPHGGTLLVRVIAAQGVPKADKFSKSDPFVRVQSAHQTVQTKTVPNNANPVWNETFELRIMHPRSEHLKFYVFDKDRKADKPLGGAECPLAALRFNEETVCWVNVGQMRLNLAFRPLNFGVTSHGHHAPPVHHMPRAYDSCHSSSHCAPVCAPPPCDPCHDEISCCSSDHCPPVCEPPKHVYVPPPAPPPVVITPEPIIEYRRDRALREDYDRLKARRHQLKWQYHHELDETHARVAALRARLSSCASDSVCTADTSCHRRGSTLCIAPPSSHGSFHSLHSDRSHKRPIKRYGY